MIFYKTVTKCPDNMNFVELMSAISIYFNSFLAVKIIFIFNFNINIFNIFFIFNRRNQQFQNKFKRTNKNKIRITQTSNLIHL